MFFLSSVHHSLSTFALKKPETSSQNSKMFNTVTGWLSTEIVITNLFCYIHGCQGQG